MTNFEAVSAKIQPYEVKAEVINLSLLDCEIVPGEPCSPENKRSIVLAAINVLKQLLPLSSETNYGRTQGYDTNKLKEKIYHLAADNGLVDIADEFDYRSKIIDRSSIW